MLLFLSAIADISSGILLDDFISSSWETHQEADKTGPKAHQRALGPTEGIGRRQMDHMHR